MAGKTTISLKVKDFGEFHNTVVRLYIDKKFDGESTTETVYIKYGFNMNADFLPCCAFMINGVVNLHKACVGKLGDIKLSKKEWLTALKAMRSKELFEKWNELLTEKKTA